MRAKKEDGDPSISRYKKKERTAEYPKRGRKGSKANLLKPGSQKGSKKKG